MVPLILITGYILNETKAKIKIYVKKPKYNSANEDFYQEHI